MRHRPRSYVRDYGESIRAVYPVNAIDAVAADLRADQRDQHVRGVPDECEIDRPTEADDGLRQPAGEDCCLAGVRIHAQDPAGGALSDIQRPVWANGAAYSSLQASDQQRGMQCATLW